MTNVLRTGIGWLGSTFLLLFVVFAIFARAPVSAIAFALGAALACPAAWPFFRKSAIRVSPLWAIAAFILGVCILALGAGAKPGGPSKNTPVAAVLNSSGDKLRSIREHVPTSALPKMTRSGYPKMYARLGREAFARADDLAIWAGTAAAENSTCGDVTTIGVSDRATRSNLVWFVDCASRERFIINQEQATAARTRYDPKATTAKLKAAETVAAVEPQSARWKNFSEASAITVCDTLVKETAVNKGSVSLAWTWDTDKDSDTGRVIFERDFSASNAFGGTISSRYQCEVNADSGAVTHFAIRELRGWRKLI